MAVPFSAEVLPAAEKNTLEGVCNVGCGAGFEPTTFGL